MLYTLSNYTVKHCYVRILKSLFIIYLYSQYSHVTVNKLVNGIAVYVTRNIVCLSFFNKFCSMSESAGGVHMSTSAFAGLLVGLVLLFALGIVIAVIVTRKCASGTFHRHGGSKKLKDFNEEVK